VTSILALDAAGAPHRWLPVEEAIFYRAKALIAWEAGDRVFTLYGGTSRATGQRSSLSVRSIVSIAGSTHCAREFRTPMVDRETLFARDRHVCAYCGQKFREVNLTADHVIPESRGGRWSWTNLVTSCRGCNNRKDARTPEEARMPLIYVPYVPNRNETFILTNRRILADQMEWLLGGVPAHSRLHLN
jgi:5-methylcytosine-specific restriction endonuclease McrA